MNATITCPQDDIVIGVCKYGGTYQIDFYDTSKKNCYGPSMFVTNALVGHRHAIVEMEPCR